MNEINIFGIQGIPEINPGDNLISYIISGLKKQGKSLENGDIVIVTSKIVSKSEGCIVAEQDIIPSDFAIQLSTSKNKTAQEIEIVLRESARPVRITEHVMIMETLHGFVCANSGIDRSNISQKDGFLLLPKDPDRSAALIRDSLQRHFGVEIAVIISDTFGRPWRVGQTNIAIGISGMLSTLDYRGTSDSFGRELEATEIAIADEIAGAAELVMGKTCQIPVAVMKGYSYPKGDGKAKDLIRSRNTDLFR